jgi:3-oxoacyl-[acyl-carrier protein] reductase
MSQHDGQRYLLMGSSSGMGKAVALELARRGGSAILAARNRSELERVQTRCQELAPHKDQRFEICTIDFLDPASPGRMAEFLGKTNEGLNGILVNGGGPHGESPTDLKAEQMDTAHSLLFKGPVLHLQAAFPVLAQEASIVAITSTTVMEPSPFLTLSGAYRSALTSYLKGLSESLGSRQIRVNAIAPGFIDTDKLNDLRTSEAQALGVSTAEVNTMWAARSRLNRIGTAEEIAHLACFLFSRECTFLTGQVLVADGGQVRSIR